MQERKLFQPSQCKQERERQKDHSDPEQDSLSEGLSHPPVQAEQIAAVVDIGQEKIQIADQTGQIRRPLGKRIVVKTDRRKQNRKQERMPERIRALKHRVTDFLFRIERNQCPGLFQPHFLQDSPVSDSMEDQKNDPGPGFVYKIQVKHAIPPSAA